MRWTGWTGGRAAVLAFGVSLGALSGVAAVAQRQAPEGYRKPVLHNRATLLRERRERLAETWERASTKHNGHAMRRLRRAKLPRVGKLCRPSPTGHETCALVHEVMWEH